MPRNSTKLPVPGEIYLLNQPRLRQSKHPHFCLVLRVEETHALVNFLSSASELFRDGQDFWLHEDDVYGEFKHTGLDKSSYLIEGAAVQVPIANLFANGPAMGQIQGRLKAQLEDWWGEKI